MVLAAVAAGLVELGFIDALVATADRVEAGSAVGAVPAEPGDDMVAPASTVLERIVSAAEGELARWRSCWRARRSAGRAALTDEPRIILMGRWARSR